MYKSGINNRASQVASKISLVPIASNVSGNIVMKKQMLHCKDKASQKEKEWIGDIKPTTNIYQLLPVDLLTNQQNVLIFEVLD